MWDSLQEFVLDDYVCEEYATSFPSARLLGNSDVGNYFICFEDYASENIQKIISLGVILMRNDADVCGKKMELSFCEGLI